MKTNTTNLENGFKSRFLISFGPRMHKVNTEDIAYIFSKNKISYFFTKNGQRIASDYRLQELEELLNPNEFCRANRQVIVHVDAVSNVKKHAASRLKLELNPPINEEIVVSTQKSREFKKWIQAF